MPGIKIELTKEKSEQQALAIELMKPFLFMLDLEYCKELVKAMYNQASMQDTLSVLNPSYDHSKSELINTQATALNHLIRYVEKLKECEALKEKIGVRQNHIAEINKMFL